MGLIPIEGLQFLRNFLPKLNVGGNSSGETLALSAIVKQEFSTRRGDTASRGRSLLQPLDQRRLQASIPERAHRGLRMLCAGKKFTITYYIASIFRRRR